MNKTVKTDRFLIILTALLMAVYLVWRLGFTIPAGKETFPVVCWVILTVVEFVGLLELIVFLYEYAKKKDVTLPTVRPAAFPDVDIFIFTINEPEDLLARTIYACRKMRYPDPRKVHIYLCDDGARASMRALAEEMEIHYLAREVNTDAKAGNFNYALIKSRSPLIAIFDADMMPKENFLMHTVPYCVADGKVGFVQTPQHFYRKDIFQRAFPRKNVPHNEQDYFYQAIQRTKNASNSVILAGSNTLIRRAAVEEIGGFVTGTLTEDFSTGIELEKKGWLGISISEVLADGLPPMDFESLIRQRRRWAKGCIQSGRKTKYLRSKTLSLRQKLNYFSSIVYWYSSLKRIIYLVAPMLFGLAGVGVMRCDPWEIAAFWLPLYICISLCVYRFSGKIRSLYWTNIYETAFMPFLLPSVLKEAAGFKQKNFDVTSKTRPAKNRKKTARYLLPFILLLVINLLTLAMVVRMSILDADLHYVLLITFQLINSYYLLMACRIVTGGAAGGESILLPLQTGMQYKDDAEAEFVKVMSASMGENTVTTTTYDEKWTGGRLRIPQKAFKDGYIELPVRYEKGGAWTIDPQNAPDDYREYIYYLFNRGNGQDFL